MPRSASVAGRGQERGDRRVVHEVDHDLAGAEPLRVDGQGLGLAGGGDDHAHAQRAWR